jgi:MYXO-CTERM domain-containing protein
MKSTSPLNLSAFIFSFSALAIAASARADFYQYSISFSGGTGFSATGVMQTKADAPSSFLEVHPTPDVIPFATTYIQSLSMNVFQASTLMGANNVVSDGVSTNRWLYFEFSSAVTPNFINVDMNTKQSLTDPYYFITDGISPDGITVPYGSTTFNLFHYDIALSQATFIGSANEFTVTQVPSPGALGLIALCGGLTRGRRRN